MRPKPTVGQEIFVKDIPYRKSDAVSIPLPGVVTKVGRKFFTVTRGGYFESEYHLENWREKTDYTPRSSLYASMQEFDDEKEIAALSDAIRERLGNYGVIQLPLETLRKINALIAP